MKRMTGRRGLRLVVLMGCAGGCVGVMLAGGCGKGDRWWQKKKEPVQAEGEGNAGAEAVDASLTALANDDDPITASVDQVEDFGSTRDQVVESARMMDEYFSGMESGVDPVEAVEITPPSSDEMARALTWQDVDDSSEPTIETDEEFGNESVGMDGSFSLASAAAERGIDGAVDEGAEVSADDSTEIVAAGVDAEQRKAELVDELVGLLTELARTSDNPGAAATALAGMDSISVETLDSLHGEGVLSDAELSTLRAVREVFDAVSSSGGIASPDAAAEALERVKRDLDRASGIRVARALLCTRVDGFGKYEPFGSNEFVAGVAQEVIVYVEVDRFGHREITGNDGQPRYEVEMSQRLELYHVADDLNTWNRKAEIDRSVSRNRVRDYYLINKITLPKNLGVGRYHLKVVMRDLIDEKVGEAIIPIRMVAR
jgi:hypothetical protein